MKSYRAEGTESPVEASAMVVYFQLMVYVQEAEDRGAFHNYGTVVLDTVPIQKAVQFDIDEAYGSLYEFWCQNEGAIIAAVTRRLPGKWGMGDQPRFTSEGLTVYLEYD